MAAPKVVKGAYFDLLCGDGALPEVFTKLCGLSTRNFTVQKNTNDVFIEDCDDPELVPQRYLNITGIQWDIAADGLYNRAQGPLIRELAQSLNSSNFRFVFGEPSGDPVDSGYWQGAAQVTNVQWGGPAGGEYSSISLTIASDGPWTFVED